MTNDKKQPGLPVVEVDQAFPLMTTDGVTRASTSAGGAGDQGPAVSAAIRDVLGWRPRPQDPRAFTAALSASFELSTVEDHVVAKYVPRGVAVQADLGGVTGGQASLYLRAKGAHEQITRMLDSLKPLRTDADPEDCEAYRGLVRDSVRRIVTELGREGGPRVPLVDSAFSVLTGSNPAAPPTSGSEDENGTEETRGLVRARLAAAALAGPNPLGSGDAIDPDHVPGQLGALRDRFGLDDDHVNTVEEEKQRTSFWTLVELVVDLQRSWTGRRLDFTLGAGNGFLGTDLVQISRLLAATAEQVDEFEAVLDSVFVSAAERQTVVLDSTTGLTLDDLIQWLRVFVTEDGPNIIRDTGRDGLVSSFTPTAVELLLTVRERLVRPLVPCAGPGCAGGCTCGLRGLVAYIPLGCCTKLPPGMSAGRVKVAASTLCGLVERLARRAVRIGRFAGVVLLDLAVIPFDTDARSVRIEVRGLHLRPTYIPAFVKGTNPVDVSALALPLQGSASGDADAISGIFRRDDLPVKLKDLMAAEGATGVVMAANEAPLAIVDGELGRVVQNPGVRSWPHLRPAYEASTEDDPTHWDKDVIPANQAFVPQDPPNPIALETSDDCLGDGDYDEEESERHHLMATRARINRVRGIANDPVVRDHTRAVLKDLGKHKDNGVVRTLISLLGNDNLSRLVEAVAGANERRAEAEAAEAEAARAEAEAAKKVRLAKANADAANDAAHRANSRHARASALHEGIRTGRTTASEEQQSIRRPTTSRLGRLTAALRAIADATHRRGKGR